MGSLDVTMFDNPPEKVVGDRLNPEPCLNFAMQGSVYSWVEQPNPLDYVASGSKGSVSLNLGEAIDVTNAPLAFNTAHARLVERQTQHSQTVPLVRAYRFKSDSGHESQ